MPSSKKPKKKIDYQQALRDVAKSMVRLRQPERLLKMITRFVDRELGLHHTSLVLLDERRSRYIFIDSKGNKRFPLGLVKFELDHPLIVWFRKRKNREILNGDYILRRTVNGWYNWPKIKSFTQETRRILPDPESHE